MATTRLEVGNVDDLKDGTMKEVPFPSKDSESKILLSKIGGKYYATSSKCTHYGAPLAKGVLGKNGRLVCPWHGACFNVCTGDIEDAPGLDNLSSFKVETVGSSIFVTGPSEEDGVTATRSPVHKPGTTRSAAGAGVVIVGGGAGGAHTIEGLRNNGYKKKITVVSHESYLPIDRTKISKALVTDPSKVALRDEAYYKNLNVEFKFDSQASSIDFESNTLSLESGEKVPYENLVVATGGAPNSLPLEGKDLGNIFQIRTIESAQAIDAAVGKGLLKKSNVVIIGSSFIGMEVAIALADRANVSVIGMEDAPFKSILGEQVGNGIRKNHEKKGIKFYLPASLDKFAPSSWDSSKVGAVVLKDGTELPADVVVLGVGVKPSTQLLKDSGIKLEKDNGVVVDKYLKLKEVAKGNVFCIGDIAHYPDYATGKDTRIEHWNVASNMGRCVGKTISGTPDVYSKIAVFWSAQGQQLRYAGTGRSKEWKDVIVQGDPGELKFVAYYYVDDEVVAVASMQNDPIVSHCSELFALHKMLKPSEIKAGKSPFDVALA